MLNDPVDILRKTKQVLATRQAELQKIKQEVIDLKSTNMMLTRKIEELEKKIQAPKPKRSSLKRAAKNNDSTNNSNK